MSSFTAVVLCHYIPKWYFEKFESWTHCFQMVLGAAGDRWNLPTLPQPQNHCGSFSWKLWLQVLKQNSCSVLSQCGPNDKVRAQRPNHVDHRPAGFKSQTPAGGKPAHNWPPREQTGTNSDHIATSGSSYKTPQKWDRNILNTRVIRILEVVQKRLWKLSRFSLWTVVLEFISSHSHSPA